MSSEKPTTNRPAHYNRSEYISKEAQDSMISFVKIVERYPELYSNGIPNVYQSKFLKELAWNKVLSDVKNELELDCTVSELKSKWKVIRLSYARYMMKLEKSMDTGTTPPKKYYLTDALEFLVPHLKQKRQVGIPKLMPKPTPGTEGVNQNEIHTSKNETLLPMIPIWSIPSMSMSTALQPMQAITPNITNVVSLNTDLKEFNAANAFPTSSSEESSLQRFKSAEEEDEEENEDLKFFKCIVPDTANFTAKDKRKLKIGVLKLIDDIESERKNKISKTNS